MYVKDVIKKVCDFIDQKDVIPFLDDQTSIGERESEVLADLITCFNNVRDEIAREYLPIMQIENFVVKNFKLNFSDFSHEICDILSVKDKMGRNVKFKVFEDYIFVCAREIEVIYSSSAEELTIEGEFSSSLPERTIGYGVAREYFFLQGKYDDANMWEERFKNSLFVLLRRKAQVRLPRRRWL